jgi:arylsulfatase A-like enzyme
MRRLCLLTLLFAGLPIVGPASAAPPNVVLIMTDNHGPWTLGCYGNPDILTPHIDRLAEQGTLFEHAYANNGVCSPTRATVLTGLMLSQHGVHRFLRGGAAQTGPQAYNMLEEFDTLPSLLVEAGYVAGLAGKWHLGGNMQPQEGFTAWITKPHGGSAGFYDQEVIEEGQVRKEPQSLTDMWTERGIRFITQNRERPFFLFLSYNGPYGLGGAMREEIRNRHRETYADHPLRSFPRTEPQPWNYNYADWIGDEQIMRKYAAEISGIDDGVGQVLQTIDELNLTDNTLVIFTADQGLAGGHAGYWGMGDHTRPLTAFDWTMHIPLIVRQPGTVPAGRRVEQIVSNYDLLPTIMSLLGLPLEEQTIDGTRLARPARDLSPLLHGDGTDWEEVHFYEFENVRAIRTPQWKYIERIHQSPNELYDLDADSDEHDNLYGQPEHEQTLLSLRRRLHEFFDKHADPKWDLWHGGRSKTDIFTEKFFGITNPYAPSNWSPTTPPRPVKAP